MLTRLGEKPLRSSEPIYVLDATSIIHFAKIDKLKLVLGICEAYMTGEVQMETVERGQGRSDAVVIRDAVERGELKVCDIRNRNLLRLFQRHPDIHLGEAETLAAAKELDAFAVIDEAEARAIAKTYGIRTRAGTLFLLFRLLALGKIEVAEGERTLDELVESGLYIDSHTLIRARKKIRSRGIDVHGKHPP
jgi:predicted nucleic acid-binding protein